MATGWGFGTGSVGIVEDLLGTERMGTSVCLIGSKPEHTVYLHISVQYIKYSFLNPKNTFFFFLTFFKFPGLLKNLTA